MAEDDEWADPPEDPNLFLQDVERFYRRRGLPVDLHPKVNLRRIDLYALFKLVVGQGGYDAVSAAKLAWRTIGDTEYHFDKNNLAAYAFALKTVYYRNLAAYEIKKVHKQEPPPKEILEQQTAKGGDLRTRTVENYQLREMSAAIPRKETHLTPHIDRSAMQVDVMEDDINGTRGRLRQAPPQRVLFQPEQSPSYNRPSPRYQLPPQPSPQPVVHSNAAYYNPASNPTMPGFSIQTYEPRPPLALTLRAVTTPALNPAYFKDKIKRAREAHLTSIGKNNSVNNGMMLPGTGFDGPNIYVRTLLALRSGLRSEQNYALHHLVKISHERGDKYRFEAFPGLAEALIERSLEIASFFFNIQWQISYDVEASNGDLATLDGVNSTADLLERIAQLKIVDEKDGVESSMFDLDLIKSIETVLILRNMTLLEENARALSDMAPVRDLLVILLNLPSRPYLAEVKSYALDLAEQLTKFWMLESDDPLFVSLVRCLDNCQDRGVAIVTLRAISRMGINLEELLPMPTFSLDLLSTLYSWMHLDDEELSEICLQILYQYTATAENVANLLSLDSNGHFSVPQLFDQFLRFLHANSETHQTKRLLVSEVHASQQPNAREPTIPEIPDQLLEHLLKLNEPERSSQWLRCCFEEDPRADITQIALWQAYQTKFTPHSTPQIPLLAAADFIKNVSTTIPSANAQVIQGATTRFIIKGIAPRRIPVDFTGRSCITCQWRPENGKQCEYFEKDGEGLWKHIVKTHIAGSRARNGAASAEQHRWQCRWAGCTHFDSKNGTVSARGLVTHIKTHLPSSPQTSISLTSESKEDMADPAKKQHSSTPGAANGDTTMVDTSPVPPSSSASTIPPHSATNILLPSAQARVSGRYSSSDESLPAIYQTFTWHDTRTDPLDANSTFGPPALALLALSNFARNIPKAITNLAKRETSQELVRRLFEPVMERLWVCVAENRTLKGAALDLVVLIEKNSSS